MEFGAIFSTFDARDFTLKSNKALLPDDYECPLNMKVKSQGNVSSCVAHAMSSILEYYTLPYTKLSTNFIYGLQKELFNKEGKGMMLRDACKIAADYGSPEYSLCPGNTEVPDCYAQASAALADTNCVSNASRYRALKYFRCKNIEDVKYAIYNYGPVLAAYDWYSTYKVVNGKLVGQQTGDSSGHAIVIYGWTKEGFLIQNSWGTRWGNAGRCLIPYEIQFREARGIIDSTDTDNLKQPVKNSFENIIYKLFNSVVNFIEKLLKKVNL